MDLLILPVSGERFPTQLGIMCKLVDCGYRPNVTFAASGGNVVAYISLAADFRSNQMIRISSDLNNKLFISSWAPPTFNIIPSWIMGLSEGSIYRRSPLYVNLFKDNFTKSTITKSEIWTGTYNQTKNRAALFCNMTRSSSIFGNDNFNNDIVSSMELQYLNGNINNIAQISIASASIPTMIEPCRINCDNYSDGGIFYASPLTPLQDIIKRKDTYHMVYINPYNIEDRLTVEGNNDKNNIIDVGKHIIDILVRAHIVQDRHVAYMLLKPYNNIVRFDIPNNISLVECLKNKYKYKRSLLELYNPIGDCINLINFNGNDIRNIVLKSKDNIQGRFWGVI